MSFVVGHDVHGTKQEGPGKLKVMGRAQWKAEFTGDPVLDSTSSPWYFWEYQKGMLQCLSIPFELESLVSIQWVFIEHLFCYMKWLKNN